MLRLLIINMGDFIASNTIIFHVNFEYWGSIFKFFCYSWISLSYEIANISKFYQNQNQSNSVFKQKKYKNRERLSMII